jgi:hypothetical protein
LLYECTAVFEHCLHIDFLGHNLRLSNANENSRQLGGFAHAVPPRP